jgi:glycosyltransferase involved in cell wall biosynthesis
MQRVDNVPKKSRNKRCTPHERMQEITDLCDVVIYQSEWAREYCKPLAGDGTIIYNGVDTDIFKPLEQERFKRYLFAYHGKSELKGFWQAHQIFQHEHKLNNGRCEFWFINDFGRDLPELQASKFDFWNGETFVHHPKVNTPEEMAEIMQECTHLIFPSWADAAPNTVLEARACGLEVIGAPPAKYSGVQEMIDLPFEDIGLERMGEEYYGVMKLLTQDI